MSDAPAAAGVGPSAGRLLREAREKQGLHIAALAASIKVPQKKLEALENDRHGDLPDATFVRALAQTVCRALKVDAAPVMALLPRAGGHRLEQVGEGLNTPFRERPGSLLPGDWKQVVASPALWLTAFVLVAALVVYLLPGSGSWLGSSRPAADGARRDASAAPVAAVAAVATAASSAVPFVAGPAGGPVAEVQASADAPPPGADPAPAIAAVPSSSEAAGVLQLKATGKSWVEIVDGRGAPLVARLMLPGEAVDVDGVPPFRVRIGNASATQLVYRGQPTDLAGYTRDNVARFELK